MDRYFLAEILLVIGIPLDVLLDGCTSRPGRICKAPAATATDDIHKYGFIVFLEKIRLDVSS